MGETVEGFETSRDGFDFQPVPACAHDANPPALDSTAIPRPRPPQFAAHQYRAFRLQSLQHERDPPLQLQRPPRAFLMTRHRRHNNARDYETRAQK